LKNKCHRIRNLLGEDNIRITPCIPGGNNRGFRVETPDTSYFAKWYFRSSLDPRDRLDNEWRFLTYAQEMGIKPVPRPVAKDSEEALAIYSFLEGTSPTTDEISEDMIIEAGAFITAINKHRHLPEAKSLPHASESCFSADEHIALVQQRLARLSAGQATARNEPRLANLLRRLNDAFGDYSDRFLQGYAKLHITPDHQLPENSRVLSPSDFGFHNSLKCNGRPLQFIDFEYAGWDDPAKVISDFFLQPRFRVPISYFDIFLEAVVEIGFDRSALLRRTELLYPLFGLRWCCIILNIFVPEGAARRNFSAEILDTEVAQRSQLDKAEQFFDDLRRNQFNVI